MFFRKFKTCSKCGQAKPLNEFHKDKSKKDGRSTKCKACTSEYTRSPARREYMRKWEKTGMGVANRKRQNQSPAGKASQKKYQESERRRENQRAYRANNPEKIKAYGIIKRAVKDGGIPHISEFVCERCGKQATDRHHADYSKPLETIALCRKCHRGTHRR